CRHGCKLEKPADRHGELHHILWQTEFILPALSKKSSSEMAARRTPPDCYPVRVEAIFPSVIPDEGKSSAHLPRDFRKGDFRRQTIIDSNGRNPFDCEHSCHHGGIFL